LYVASNPSLPLVSKLKPSRINTGAYFKKGFLFSMNGEGHEARIFGIATELNFGKHLSFLLGIEHLNIRFYLLSTNELSHYPRVYPDDPNDSFFGLTSNFSYLQIPIGLKYSIWKDKKFRPYLSTHLIARKPMYQNFNFSYTSNQSYFINRSFNSAPFVFNSIRQTVGLEYTWRQNLVLKLEAGFENDFRKSLYEFEQIKMLHLGLEMAYIF